MSSISFGTVSKSYATLSTVKILILNLLNFQLFDKYLYQMFIYIGLLQMFIQNKYYTWYYNIINNRCLSFFPGYTEKHHIIPKSLGGTDDPDNLVNLTAREHFICHCLLTKFTSGEEKAKMVFAFRMFLASPKNNDQRYINARLYEYSKKEHALAMSDLHRDKTVSAETRLRISESAKGRVSPFKGKKHTKETKNLISKKARGHTRNTPEIVDKIISSRSWYSHSEETKQKISSSNKGKTFDHSNETKRKISETMKGREVPWLKGKQAHNNGVSHTKETKQKMSDKAKKREPKICEYCSLSVSPSNYTRWHGNNCKQNK